MRTIGRMVLLGLILFQSLALALAPAAVAAPAGPASDATVARQAQALLDSVTTVDGPGAVMLIARGDKVIYRAARGRANIELGVPMSPDQTFRIASITKSFTAAEVLKLAERGTLSLGDPLSKYIPDFPNGDQITVRQLLNHTAGIGEKPRTVTPGFGRLDFDTATRVAELRTREPAAAPGATWAYSNNGYLLLGAIIETVTGKPWHEAIREDLTAPLGLKHTVYDDAALVLSGRVAGYSTDNPGRVVRNAKFISMTTPAAAGSLVSTADDLRVWIRGLARGRAVSEASFREMITPAPHTDTTPYVYGMGLYLWKVRGSPMIGHTGQIDGFASAVGYLPDQDITVVVLGNNDRFNARMVARQMAAIAMGRPYGPAEPASPSEADLQALTGRYQDDPTTLRTVLVRDGKLYTQRGERPPLPLMPTTAGELRFIPDELSYFLPVRDASGRVVRLDYYRDGEGPPRSMPRVD